MFFFGPKEATIVRQVEGNLCSPWCTAKHLFIRNIVDAHPSIEPSSIKSFLLRMEFLPRNKHATSKD